MFTLTPKFNITLKTKYFKWAQSLIFRAIHCKTWIPYWIQNFPPLSHPKTRLAGQQFWAFRFPLLDPASGLMLRFGVWRGRGRTSCRDDTADRSPSVVVGLWIARRHQCELKCATITLHGWSKRDAPCIDKGIDSRELLQAELGTTARFHHHLLNARSHHGATCFHCKWLLILWNVFFFTN